MKSTPTPTLPERGSQRSPLGRIEKVESVPEHDVFREVLNGCVRLHVACVAALRELLLAEPPGDADRSDPTGAREAQARLILSAVEVTQLCADFLIRRSEHTELTLRLCADVCRSLLSPGPAFPTSAALYEPLRRCALACDAHLRELESTRQPVSACG